MHCAECGLPLMQLTNGAYLRCCSGLGYWHDAPPMPGDAWASELKSGRWYLYLNPKWPNGKRPILPHD